MTKYEWESELKKNIHRLPADEIKRVMEYYDELFADMIERGKGECEIIGEFGNPVDVADKILSEYDGELLKESSPVITPDSSTFAASDKSERKHEENKCDGGCAESAAVIPEIELAKSDPEPMPKNCGDGKVHFGRLAIFVGLNILTGFAFFWIILAVWIAAVAFIIAGAAMAVGGAAGTVISLIQVFRGFAGAGFAQTGMCIALCGLGILLSVFMIKAMKLLGKATAALFSRISRWIYTPKPDLSGTAAEYTR